MIKFFRLTAKGLFVAAAVMMTLWAIGAITYSNLSASWMRMACAVAFVMAAVVPFYRIKRFYKAILAFGVLWGLVLAWWLLIPPSNNRHWQPDVAILPSAQIDGNMLTVHNVRNCDYRTETDYTVSHYDRTFDLTKLQGVDLFLCFWDSPLITHTIMSFCFEGDQYLCISIETRKEIGEGYSAVKGFFKQYELIYVVADERDLIRLRTDFRKETVYLYRLSSGPELTQQVLLSYLDSINRLHRRPEWYNAVTQNCTTAIRGHTAPYAHGKMSWRILVNGYLDTLLYERGIIDVSLPLGQMRENSCISDKAASVLDISDFSKIIRDGLPNPRIKTQKHSLVPGG